MELLAKRPEQRPPSAPTVLDRLVKIEAALPASPARPAEVGPTSRSGDLRSRRRIIAGLAILVVAFAAAVALGIMFGHSRPSQRAASAPKSEVAAAERVYLKNLKVVASEYWPLPPGPKGEPIPNPFRTISVNGKESPNGIGMHPGPEGPASVTYALDGQYDAFHSQVSLNDSADVPPPPMIFSVYGDDDRLLWRNKKPVLTTDDKEACSVSVKGVNRLTLEVAVNGKAKVKGAHGVWIEPYLTK
jgi:hypothetical protein